MPKRTRPPKTSAHPQIGQHLQQSHLNQFRAQSSSQVAKGVRSPSAKHLALPLLLASPVRERVWLSIHSALDSCRASERSVTLLAPNHSIMSTCYKPAPVPLTLLPGQWQARESPDGIFLARHCLAADEHLMDRQVRTTFGPSASYAPKLALVPLPRLERFDVAQHDSYMIALTSQAHTPVEFRSLGKDLFQRWQADKSLLLACKPNRAKLNDEWFCIALFAPGPPETNLCCALALVPKQMIPEDAPMQVWTPETDAPLARPLDPHRHFDYYLDEPLFVSLDLTAADDQDDELSLWSQCTRAQARSISAYRPSWLDYEPRISSERP